MKKTKVDDLFYTCSQANLISKELVDRLKLETYSHLSLYSLGLVNKGLGIKVTKQCKIIFDIDKKIIDEVIVDVIPLDLYGVVFGSPYMYVRDVIFIRKANQYLLVKDGNSYIISSYLGDSNISLVRTNESQKFINASGKFALLMLRGMSDNGSMFSNKEQA